MLEHPGIAPELSVKVLEAEPELVQKLPPIESNISFLPFVNYLKEKLHTASGIRAEIYHQLVDKFESTPSLLRPIKEEDLLQDNVPLLEMLATSIFPVVGEEEKNIFTFASPNQSRIFFYTDAFRELFTDGDQEKFLFPEGVSEADLKEVYCASIYEQVLEKFYGVELADTSSLIYPVTDRKTGMKKFYRLNYDRRFIDIQLKGELPPLKDCAVCLNSFRILDLEKQLATMPLDLFRLEGFAVLVAEDITNAQAVESIRKILLKQSGCDTSIIHDLKEAVHNMTGLQDIEIGIMPFMKVNNHFVLEDSCSAHSIIGKNWKSTSLDDRETFNTLMSVLENLPEPIALSILDQSVFEVVPPVKSVWEMGFRSYIICPLQNNDGFLGLIEIGSKIPGQLNQDILRKIESALPLLSLAFLKNRENFNSSIEKLIKEKFTALQPAVEWKFADIAWQFLNQKDPGIDPVCKVAFENVFPLYGAIDIRNSSLERNKAIQKDLLEHLQMVDTTLENLQQKLHLDILEGLRYKNNNLRKNLEFGLQSEEEITISEFLQNEVDAVFSHLQKSNNDAKQIVEQYYASAQSCEGCMQRNRKDYEETLVEINNAVLNYLSKEENEIQQSYPHYFEKYRTDGVEYSIYIGQSIAPENPFDNLYLKNIRLWQLRSMAEIARTTHALVPSLKVPLETTQLILVHSQPISISFRKDERRFDVEGAYNIRYEVVKKRIDKARLKDSDERLTQVGKIALVYTSQKEAQEYQEYIGFLQNKGILLPGIEYVELEELQAVTGLKALRVDINMEMQ